MPAYASRYWINNENAKFNILRPLPLHLINNENVCLVDLIQSHIKRLENELCQNSTRKQTSRTKESDFINTGKKRWKNEFYYRVHRFNTKGKFTYKYG